jgi:acyl-coenzyme A synthetase/AMP-(fatty) acid ligase
MANFTHTLLVRNLDKTAVIDDQQSVSYDELRMYIKRYAYCLKANGIKPGDKIIIALPDSVEWCVAFLAAIYVGAVAVIISDKTPADKIIPSTLHIKHPHGILIDQGDQLEEHYEYNDDEVGFYLTTSGTTGNQKYIIHRHQSLLDYFSLVVNLFEVDQSSVIFSSPRLSFGYGFGVNIILGLGVGSTILLTNKILSNKLLGQKITTHSISHFFSTPVFLSMLVKHAPSDAVRDLKLITSAGEPMSSLIKQQFFDLYGKHILNGYGLSETLSYVSTQQSADLTQDYRIIGKPAPGVEVKIQDGKLFVKHPCKAIGYLDGDTFQEDWIQTNDIVELNDQGELIYISRLDNLVKINGEFVSIDEVEDAILQHDQIEECLVFTELNVMGLLELKANVITSNNVTAGMIRRFLYNRLESHKIPKHIYFVHSIPKTITNKKIRNKSLQSE